MARFFVGYPWRFLIVHLETWATVMCLDSFAFDKSGALLLNQPSYFGGKAPADDPRVWLTKSDEPYLAEGVRALVGLRREGGATPYTARFAGRILQVQDDGGDNGNPTSTYSAFDEWAYLYTQPIRTATGALPGKNGLRSDTPDLPQTKGNEIALALLQQSIGNDGPVYIDVTNGTFEDTDDLDITFQPAISVGEAWDQLCATGSLDIVLRPVWEPLTRPFVLNELSIYAQVGTTKPQAVFAWGRAPYSLRTITRLEDGRKRVNKAQFYAGDASKPVALATEAPSVAKYGSYWSQEVRTDEEIEAATESLALERLRLAKNGQTTVSISPFPERAPIPFVAYDVGDRVRVLAPKTKLRKNVDGYERIYGIPVAIGDDQIETIDSLQTSPDGVA